jgi:flagellar biosynthesis/type III secretory pathway chaperone
LTALPLDTRPLPCFPKQTLWASKLETVLVKEQFILSQERLSIEKIIKRKEPL